VLITSRSPHVSAPQFSKPPALFLRLIHNLYSVIIGVLCCDEAMKVPLLFLAICFFSVAAYAQSSSPSPVASPNSISLKDYREILENERKLLNDESEKYYNRIDSLINRTTWAIGAIGVFAVAVMGFLIGKTRKELQELVKEQVKLQTAAFIETEMTSLRSSVESEAATLRTSIQEIQAEVNSLRAFQNQLIVWVFAGTEMDAQPEMDALRQTGLSNISVLTPGEEEGFELGEPDLVILSFDGTDEGRRRLQIIVAALREKSPPVSLLIYTYNPNMEVRLQEADWAILEGFRWFLPVNFPTTLISQAQTLVRTNRADIN
jgi:hypothetical protein